jgi:chromosome segregation ATPase
MSDDVDAKPTTGSDDPPSKSDDQLAELQTQLDALKRERDDWKGRFESDKSERDAAKKRAREEAEKRGEYEKVLTELKAEIEQYKPIAEQFDAVKAERDALVEERRSELLSRLPEDQRKEWADADTTTLTKLVKTLSIAQPNIPGTHTGTGTPKGGARSWGEMTMSEKTEYMASHSSEDVQAKIRAWRAGK